MSNTTKTVSNGIGLGGWIFLIFLTLKLAEIGPVAEWSWWWITAPLWIPFGVVISILLVVGLVMTLGVITLKAFEFGTRRTRR